MFILNIYKNIFSFLRSNRKLVFITLLFIAESIVFCLLNCEADISRYMSYYNAARPQYSDLFSFILVKNMQTMLMTVLIGTIPLFIGTMFNSYLTVRSLTVVCKYAVAETSVVTVLASTLPHGAFEIPATIFSIILSAIISKEITLFLLSLIARKKFDDPESVFYRHGLKETAVFCFESLVFVVLPLILLGALTETFVTGWVVEWVL